MAQHSRRLRRERAKHIARRLQLVKNLWKVSDAEIQDPDGWMHGGSRFSKNNLTCGCTIHRMERLFAHKNLATTQHLRAGTLADWE